MSIVGFADNELLEYVANRSSKLRRLEISCCYEDPYESWIEALKKCPLLEELSICLTDIPKEAIETSGRCCPMLKTLKLNDNPLRNREFPRVANERAIAIGENLCELRHLELIGDNMSNIGLEVILDGCRHLESLELRACFYLDLEEGDPDPIGKIKCLDNNIECVKLPKDSLSGCIYREFLYNYDDRIKTFFGFLDDDDKLPNMEELRKTLASLSMLE
ncbi:putative F-box/LRR-repeat protein 23 [Lactuca sativa]|uniref:putative F-box/LRR-repeat protein 23 n=1 Tax=Lactuca sativa TaxID=4236 RepID=UPI000CB04633|nr:putative F-box/LRR-repeat protein 23 [Lactuca sativa]